MFIWRLGRLAHLSNTLRQVVIPAYSPKASLREMLRKKETQMSAGLEHLLISCLLTIIGVW